MPGAGNSERGSVLFRILLSVALFVSLGYAVTRTKSGDTAKEKPGLVAAQLAEYGAGLTSAVSRLRISNSCSDLDLNFGNSTLVDPAFPGGSLNLSSPFDGRCNVFGRATGATYWDPRKQLLPRSADDFLYFTSALAVKDIGTDATELSLVYVMANNETNLKICETYNRKAGNFGDMTAGSARAAAWLPARGSGLAYSSNPPADQQIGEDPDPSAFRGKPTGCLMGGSTHDGNALVFYYVILPR